MGDLWDDVDNFKRLHDDLIERLNNQYKGRGVTLNHVMRSKKARGRNALIDNIILHKGIALFLCMVLRNGSDAEMLNGDGWTRSYRPFNHFTLWDV